MSQLIRSTRMVSGLTLLSRVFGLVREQTLAALLAAGPEADAFQIAFRIPNMLRDLFAEGALSAAFVPTFAHVTHKRSLHAGFVLAHRVMGCLCVIIGLLTLLGYLHTSGLVHLLAPDFAQISGKTDLTIVLTRVMLPFLLLLSLSAVFMGMLNASHIYGPPAFAPAAFNLVAITFGIAMLFMHLTPAQMAWGWSLGVVMGGAAQLLVQLPAARRMDFHFRLQFTIDRDVKSMLLLMAPASIGLAATQINLVVNSAFASAYPGAIAYLSYAFRLLYLPIGVFGVAIGTISAANVAKHVAQGDEVAVRRTVRQGLALVAFLTIPSSVGLWVLATPIVAMIYQRRAFSLLDTQAVARATAVYALGLFAYSAVKVLAPIYYARKKTTVPVLASISAVAANICVSYFFRARFGFAAMALGTSAAAWINIAVLRAALPRVRDLSQEEKTQMRQTLQSFFKTILASAVMGITGVYLLHILGPVWQTRHEWARWSIGVGLTMMCGIIYIGFAVLLRIPEAQLFTRYVSRKSKVEN